jgi:hypothetical protein
MSRGAIRGDALTGKIELQCIGSTPTLERHDVDISGSLQSGHAGGDQVLMDALYRSMTESAPPPVGVEEGIKSAVVSFAIDEAMDTGRVVHLESYWTKAGIS